MDKGIYSQQTELFGSAIHQTTCITGKGAPTPYIQGAVGCLYMDEDNYKTYKCVSTKDGQCVWEPVGLGGGSTAIKNTAIGELISLSDSAEQPLQSMKILGKTQQTIGTGNQMLGAEIAEDSSGAIFNDDGTVTVEYGCGECAIIIAEDAIQTWGDKRTLYLTIEPVNGVPLSENSIEISLWGLENSTLSYTVLSSGSTYKAKIQYEIAEEDKNSGAMLVIAFMDDNIDFFTYKVMLAGVYDADWEPYTGGIALPNPNSPQEYISAGNRGNITIHSEESLLTDNIIANSNGIIFNDDGTMLMTADGEGHIEIPIEVIKNQDSDVYYLTVEIIKGNIYYSGARFMEYFYIDNDEVALMEATRLYASNNKFKEKIELKDSMTSNLFIKLGSIKHGSIFKLILTTKENSSQSVTIKTPDGLPGVPFYPGNDWVLPFGNYTDADGKSYVCNEIDFKKLVKKQRTCELIMTGDENILRVGDGTFSFKPPLLPPDYYRPCLCTHFRGVLKNREGQFLSGDYENVIFTMGEIFINTSNFTSVDEFKSWLKSQYEAGTPVKILYVLDEPIETPLADEEIQALKDLATHYPSTFIYNNDGAHMEIKYVADTKNYIDNKINKAVEELSAAIITE